MCVNFGDKYNNAYVDALYHMVFKYNKIDHFICITDRYRNINNKIQQYMVPKSEYEGAWNKLHYFNPILPLPNEFIALDLDIIIQSRYSFNKIESNALLFINPEWGDDSNMDDIAQPTFINSSIMYINRESNQYKKISKAIERGDWYPFWSMDRFFYNILGKKSTRYFHDLKVYSYLDQQKIRREQKDMHVCLLNKTGGNFFLSLDKNHWIFNYYPVHLSYPSTYHIDQ